MPKSNGVKLVCQRGSIHWAEPKVYEVEGGVKLGIECDFGERPMTHWFMQIPGKTIRYDFGDTPTVWASAFQAFAALDVYRKSKERETHDGH